MPVIINQYDSYSFKMERVNIAKTTRDYFLKYYDYKGTEPEFKALMYLFFSSKEEEDWEWDDSLRDCSDYVSQCDRRKELKKSIQTITVNSTRVSRGLAGIWMGVNPKRESCSIKRFLKDLHKKHPELNLKWLIGNKSVFTRVTYDIPAENQKVIEQELLTLDANRVNLFTGNKINRRERGQLLAEERTLLSKYLTCTCVSELGKEFVEYLNTLDTNVFSKQVNKNWDTVIERAYALPVKSRKNQLRVLDSIDMQPVPIYRCGENTPRLTPLGESLVGLKTELREIILDGWIELDLKQAQLAIIAKIWDIPELNEAIQSGVWNLLLDDLMESESNPKELKGKIKKGIYSVCFGKSKRNLKTDLLTEFDDNAEQRDKFLNHQIIKILLKRRAKKMKEVTEEGGLTDCWGTFHSVKPYQAKESDKRKTIPSALAYECQAIEQVLIFEIVKLGIEENKKQRPRFKILLYQYDGVSISAKSDEREPVIKMLSKAINKKAEELGILTSLEVK